MIEIIELASTHMKSGCEQLNNACTIHNLPFKYNFAMRARNYSTYSQIKQSNLNTIEITNCKSIIDE